MFSEERMWKMLCEMAGRGWTGNKIYVILKIFRPGQ